MVERSVTSDNGLWGIVARYDDHLRIDRNVVDGNDAEGITVDRTTRAVVTRNVVTGSEIGIHLVDLHDARVRDNDAVVVRS